MKRPLLTAILTLFLLGSAHGQNRLSLGMEGGAGLGLYRDLGTSPITYRGLEADLAYSLRLRTPLWHFQATLGGYGGGYGLRPSFAYMQNYGGLPAFALSAMRRLSPATHLDLWLGTALDEQMDIRYAASLGNTANSFSNFVNLSLLSKAEYTLGNFRFHAQASFALPSLCLRPGFAYLDNFNQDISNPTTNTFDQYQWYLTGLNQVSTELGAFYILPNGNQLGLSYRWRYLTSRTSVLAPYRFEQAGHALLLFLDFLLN